MCKDGYPKYEVQKKNTIIDSIKKLIAYFWIVCIVFWLALPVVALWKLSFKYVFGI